MKYWKRLLFIFSLSLLWQPAFACQFHAGLGAYDSYSFFTEPEFGDDENQARVAPEEALKKPISKNSKTTPKENFPQPQ